MTTGVAIGLGLAAYFLVGALAFMGMMLATMDEPRMAVRVVLRLFAFFCWPIILVAIFVSAFVGMVAG